MTFYTYGRIIRTVPGIIMINKDNIKEIVINKYNNTEYAIEAKLRDYTDWPTHAKYDTGIALISYCKDVDAFKAIRWLYTIWESLTNNVSIDLFNMTYKDEKKKK